MTTQRIADMQSRAQMGHAGAAPQATMEHVMMSTRARVLSRPGVDVLRQWALQPRSTSFGKLDAVHQAGQLYAATVSALQLKDWKLAEEMASRLLAASKGDADGLRQAQLLHAELKFGLGQPAAALDALPQEAASAEHKPPEVTASGNLAGPSLATVTVTAPRSQRRPELLLRTEALLAQRNAASMISPLQTWLADHGRDAHAWRLLARVWREQGQELRALRADAEAQMAHYDYAGAVDRFKAAQDLSRKRGGQADYIEASIIDTRLREAQDLLKEQAREKRVD